MTKIFNNELLKNFEKSVNIHGVYSDRRLSLDHPLCLCVCLSFSQKRDHVSISNKYGII